MKLEWLNEAKIEYRDILLFYRTKVGPDAARNFSSKILSSIRQLKKYPEMGVIKTNTLLGKYGFRALYIDKYVCVYRIDNNTVFIYHLADARTNYIYRIFGIEN